MYAAIKQGGRKLYEIARAGETVERPPRHIRIETLALLGWEPPVARLLIDCSKGTYIRAIARDLGTALGCGAHLGRLSRLRTGPFFLDQALTLGALAEEFTETPWPELALHPDAALLDWPAIVLDEAGALAWQQGKELRVGSGAAGDTAAPTRPTATGSASVGSIRSGARGTPRRWWRDDRQPALEWRR
jgi:tRNA pseudouridine55 synthase